MAALTARNLTLLDMAKRKDPDGSPAKIVEILNETNDILDHMVWKTGNLTDGHQTTIRTGIPEPTWVKMYTRVQPTKSTTVQVVDRCGKLEAYAEVSKRLVDLEDEGSKTDFLLSENRPHIEGFNQTVARTLFYGNEGTNPDHFTGLAPRFNSRLAENGENIIHGGSSDTDNRSIWLVVWGDETVHGIVPKGSVAGLQMRNLGEATSETSEGLLQVYRTFYEWSVGLTVRDWRYVVRIANIEWSALTKDATSGADLNDLMFQAMRRVPSLRMGRPQFYMSRDMLTFLCRQTSAKVKESTLTTDMLGGKLVTSFHGIPIGQVDALAGDEALVP